MKWNRFTIKTKTEAEDVIISALADVGVEGVEIQDKQPLTETDKEQMFVDIMPEGPADDGIAYLNFYLEEDTETAPVLERVRAVLEEVRGYMDIVEGFTPDDFKRLASRILADGNMLEVIMEPEPAPQAE